MHNFKMDEVSNDIIYSIQFNALVLSLFYNSKSSKPNAQPMRWTICF